MKYFSLIWFSDKNNWTIVHDLICRTGDTRWVNRELLPKISGVLFISVDIGEMSALQRVRTRGGSMLNVHILSNLRLVKLYIYIFPMTSSRWVMYIDQQYKNRQTRTSVSPSLLQGKTTRYLRVIYMQTTTHKNSQNSGFDPVNIFISPLLGHQQRNSTPRLQPSSTITAADTPLETMITPAETPLETSITAADTPQETSIIATETPLKTSITTVDTPLDTSITADLPGDLVWGLHRKKNWYPAKFCTLEKIPSNL